MMIEEFTSPLIAEMRANKGNNIFHIQHLYINISHYFSLNTLYISYKYILTSLLSNIKHTYKIGIITRGDITVKLAEYYGFCWGVERAIAMAYEARSHFPTSTIHITNEIIHNPQVNDRLHEMDIKFIENDKVTGKDYSIVKEGDVVILPAFGIYIYIIYYTSLYTIQFQYLLCRTFIIII